VLFSNQHGAVVRFDNFATGSGSLDLQTSSAFNLGALAGAFAFNVSGVDSGGASEASAGVFTVDASGNLIAGVQDNSDNGGVTQNDALTAVPAAMTAPVSGSGRGTLTLISAALGTRNFAFYVVGANQIRMIEIDSLPALAGDAFRQISTAISGSFAFTAAGSNLTSPFAAGGILDTDGAGNVLGTSVEDVNAGGTINSGVSLSGSFSAIANGRSTLSLNGAIHYAVYPSTAGLQLLRIDSNFVVSGTAFQQSGSFSDSTINGRYGANITGVAGSSIGPIEFDGVYHLTANGTGQLTGAQDLNSFGTLAPNLSVSGTAHLAANGRSPTGTAGTLNTAAANLQVIYYAVSGSQILFIEVDNNSVAAGTLSQQQ